MAIATVDLVTSLHGQEQYLPVSEIHVDLSYQRPLDMSRVSKMAAVFDPELITRLVVHQRANGEYFVVDGQHRLAVLKRVGQQHAPCVVCSGWSHEREAHMFVGLNMNHRNPSRFQLHKAMLEEGDPRAVAIESVVRSLGCELAEHESRARPYRIRAIDKVYTIYNSRHGGEQGLREVLTILIEAYQDDAHAYASEMLTGLHSFLKRATKDPNFDRARLVSVLRSTPIDEIHREMKARAVGRGRIEKIVPYVLATFYNRYLRTRRLTCFDLPDA